MADFNEWLVRRPLLARCFLGRWGALPSSCLVFDSKLGANLDQLHQQAAAVSQAQPSPPSLQAPHAPCPGLPATGDSAHPGPHHWAARYPLGGSRAAA